MKTFILKNNLNYENNLIELPIEGEQKKGIIPSVNTLTIFAESKEEAEKIATLYKQKKRVGKKMLNSIFKNSLN